MKNNLFEKIKGLETIEEKSFWVIAPLVTVVGLLGLLTAGFYESPWPTLISALLCLVIPSVLMVFVYDRQNYHYAYPLLCIFTGAFSVPLTFIFSGGFLSGMPLICAASTAITAFCYLDKWRRISLISCLIGNSIAFIYVYKYGSPYPLEGITAIYNDVLFGYFTVSFSLFFSINMIINEIRKYRINQDALQQYFDIEVRKEILKKALNGEVSTNSEKKKAAIMFADISNFTTITEKMPTEKISKFLNEFFSIAEKEIHKNNGIIDKYIGDCVMAYWLDDADSNCVFKAVKTVHEIRNELYQKSETIYKDYETELNFSAGIAYGDVIFGDIGSENRHEYTIIGDAVNTASRIESYAAGGELLMSDNAATMVKDTVELENVETNMYFKGKNRSVNLYRAIKIKEAISESNIVKSDNYGYSIYVCGCRGSFPVSGLRFSEYGGETSCYVVKKDDYAVVVDCGTGLKNASYILNDCSKIDILLTHVHYDHILGLLMAKLPEKAKIRIFGHFSSWGTNSNTLTNFMDHPYWPIEIKDIETNCVDLKKTIELEKDINVTFYRSDHPDEACVIKMMCKNKKVCFFADCEDTNKLDDEIAINADILFFDGMFDDKETTDHTGWGHGTWQQGVKYAENLHIRNLIITHHNPENGDHTLLTNEIEARSLSKNVSFAKSGDRIVI